MESTTKVSTFNLTKIKIARGAILVLFTFIVGHSPVMDGCFPAAIALVSYMVYKNIVNLYLIIPAAAGILPYIVKGYDPWGDLLAIIVCGVLFAMAKDIKLSLFQTALITASTSIICISISRLATVTVYKVSPQKLMFIGFMIFSLVLIFDTIYRLWEDCDDDNIVLAKQMPLISLVSICLIAANGIGISFLSWPVILFLVLLTLVYIDAGAALLTVTVGAIWAALMDQGQWGFMATIAIGIVVSLFAKPFGALLCTAIFTFICWGLGSAESGVILGVDSYCLLLAAAIFIAINWKFGPRMKKFIMIFEGENGFVKEEVERNASLMLKAKAEEMEDLAELYSTYLDSRSVLANQFDITKQIMDNVRHNMNAGIRNKRSLIHDKFDVDISVLQCAASGAINGDCCGWQDIGDGKIAMVVSDGMGKGKKAAAESLMVTKTIISLLKSGVPTDLTLKMINTVMLIKDDEDSYATVDLVIVDKRTGQTKFYKIGAAPTLIRRKNNVEEVQLSAVPLGIVNGLKIRYMETVLKKEDWIIMMSDGVSDGGVTATGQNDGFLSILKETAAKVRSKDPQIMANLLINQAADSYIGRERDDLTVLVARII